MHMLRQWCSLSMLHRTCKNGMGTLGWVDWACPISCTCLFIFIRSLHTQINICSGTVIITYQQNILQLTHLLTGPKQFVINLSFSRKKWIISGRHSLTSGESNYANNQSTADAKPTNNEVMAKGHIVIPYTQGLCKSIKMICSMYDIESHFKGNSTIKNLLVFSKDTGPWKTKVGPSTGSNVGTLHMRRNT